MVEGIMDQIRTLIDSGSSQNFIDVSFAQTHNIPLVKLSKPCTIIAINGKKQHIPSHTKFGLRSPLKENHSNSNSMSCISGKTQISSLG